MSYAENANEVPLKAFFFCLWGCFNCWWLMDGGVGKSYLGPAELESFIYCFG